MAVPDSLLPMDAEKQRLAQYRAIDAQLQAEASHPQARARGERLQRKYKKYPWLSPGIATSYAKWEEQLGTPIARDLARKTVKLFGQEGATAVGVQEEMEKYIATKDFQAQVSGEIESYYNEETKFKDLGKLQRRIVRNIQREKFESGDQTNPIGDLLGQVTELPGAKSVSRTLFTALESPYQEAQAGASRLITAGLGSVATTSTQPGAINPLEFGQQRPVLADITRAGAAVESGQEALGIESGMHPNAAGLFGGVSTGAIAIDRILSGEDSGLGSGWFPGGETRERHERAVRNVASIRYADTGEKNEQLHFATPGRIFAAAVTEPGTDPYNTLSGVIDAAAIIKADPANIALTTVANINKARKGFSPATMEEAGGFVGKMTRFVHPPTARAWLDDTGWRKGARFVDEVAYNLHPEDFAELGRRSGWKIPHNVMVGMLEADTPQDVRAILEPALGVGIQNKPSLTGFAAGIRNVTGQHRLLSEVPGRLLRLNAENLSGPNGSMRQLANHALGLGLDDKQIGNALFDIASSSGKTERSVNMLKYFDMEYQGLINKGMTPAEATKLTRFAREDLYGRARVYFDREIATGEYVPGYMIEGERFPLDTPFLASEHLGDLLTLPALTGKGGRNQMLAKYGRLMGIKGTSVGERTKKKAAEFVEMGDEFGEVALGEQFGLPNHIRNFAWSSNAWGIHLQSALWKPMQLLRGAWTVRVIGEEQVRMAMAGFDAMFNHPIRYIGWQAAKSRAKKGQDDALKDAMDWVSEMGGFRNQMLDESFWQRTRHSGRRTDDATTGVFTDSPLGRKIASNTVTLEPTNSGYAQVWADKLITYHSDEVMSSLANAVIDPDTARYLDPVDEIADRMLNGDLTFARRDLSHDPKFAEAGIDLNSEEGVRRYVEETYDRLVTYTAQDSDLMRMIAKGSFEPNVAKQAAKFNLKGGTRVVDIDGSAGKIVEHSKGEPVMRVHFDDNTDRLVAAEDLKFEGGERKVLTKNADNVSLDPDFMRYLNSVDDELKPGTITGVADAFGPDDRAGLDVVVKFMFANLMDRPTSYLNRSTIFMQERYNQLERLLPHMDETARTKVLKEARSTLRGSKNPVLNRALKKRYDSLVDASAKGVGTKGTQVRTEALDKARARLQSGDYPYIGHAEQVGDNGVYLDAWHIPEPERGVAGIKGGREVLADADRTGTTLYLSVDMEADNADKLVKFYERAGFVEGRHPGSLGYSEPGLKDMRRDPRAGVGPKTVEGKLNFDEADQIAKGHSLDKVRELLYDVHRRNATFSALQLLAPFGEAWKEMLGSWGRILVERPQTVRKFQVAVTAAEGANPFDLVPGAVGEHQAGQGFFHKDPERPEDGMLFTYPWSQAINENLVGVPLPMRGRAQQLNMGFSLVPGVGPAFQIPGMALMDRFMDDKKWDPLRQILAPYGYPDVGEGSIIEQAFLPAWAKTALRSFSDVNAGTVDAKSLNNTTSAIYQYGVSTGEYEPNDPERIKKDFDDAYKKAREVLRIQAFAKFFMPASPSLDFLTETKNGNLIQASVLGKAMRDLRNEDSETAVLKFIEQFGEGAIYATGPKSLGDTFGAQYTKTGLDWERDHKDLVDEYELTFSEYIPRPKKEEPFSFQAYLRAAGEGRIEPLEPKEWLKRTNNMLGSMWYDKIRSDPVEKNGFGLKDGEPGNRGQQLALAEIRGKIAAAYPGWREIRTDPSIIPQAVDELYRAAKDPRIKKANPSLYRDLNKYIAERNEAIEAATNAGSPGDFQNPGFAQAGKYAGIRTELRRVAAELGKKNPQFLALWEDVFEREMKEDD